LSLFPLDKSLSGVFSDSDTKRLLSEAEQEGDNVQSQIAAAESSEIVPEQVINTGLAVLQDMATFWKEASLATKQQLQRFLFPEGIAYGEAGFGTYTTAFCIQQKAVVSMSKNTMVDQADPSWNLLLVELSRLSKIAEQSANDNNRESFGTAAPELGER